MSESMFSSVAAVPPIEVFKLMADYQNDPSPNKVSLSAGAYRTDEGKPWILPVVKKVETMLTEQICEEKINHEYFPILGLESFSSAATKMLLGDESPALKEERAFGLQTLSGTGALRVAADFLRKSMGMTTVYVSDPTWGNHNFIFKDADFTDVKKYRYWSQENRNLDIEGMLEDLEAAPEKSVIVLHACAHNPTGIDPTKEQWGRIADVIEKKNLFTFFDCAYQGFASGSLDDDAWSVRYFVDRGFELFCAQSFSKNFGLYNLRTGNLTLVMKNGSPIPNVKSQLSRNVRGMYSNPPSMGCRIVDTVLKNPELFEEWKESIKVMANRIIGVRKGLRDELERLGTPGDWSHITDQIGMFSFTGLSPEMCKFLIEEKHIYLLKNGRISMCGINPSNLPYVAKSIDEAVRKFQ